jgi:F0F1-type ATP synthase assembly protein I
MRCDIIAGGVIVLMTIIGLGLRYFKVVRSCENARHCDQQDRQYQQTSIQ